MKLVVACVCSIYRIYYFLNVNCFITILLLCSHSPNDVPPVPQRNVSIAAERGAVRPSTSSLYLRGESFIIRWEGAGTFSGAGGSDFFFCDLLGRGSEINNSWSRGKGSYNFRHKRRRGSEFSFHKKTQKHPSFYGANPQIAIAQIFSVSILSDLGKTWFPFLHQGHEFIIFFSGCLNLSVSLFIGNMVLVRNVQQPSITSRLKGLLSFL